MKPKSAIISIATVVISSVLFTTSVLAQGVSRIVDNTVGSTGNYNSLTTDSRGLLAATHIDFTNNHLRLWYDDGAGDGVAGDRKATPGEIRIIDSNGTFTLTTSITTDANDRLAVCYYQEASNDLKLWVDDGAGGGVAGDGYATSGEIRFIDTAGNTGGKCAITKTSSNRLAVAYRTFQAPAGVRLWVDDGRSGGTAGDAKATAGEIRTIDGNGSAASYVSIAVNASGRLAVAYYIIGTPRLTLWLDDGRSGGTAGDGVATAGEIRVIDATNDVGSYNSIAVDHNGYLAISYYDSTNTNLKLWLDDGQGGGIAGDGLATAGEIRVIDSAGHVGGYASMTLVEDSLAISYYDSSNSRLKLWLDEGAGGGVARDGNATAGEISVLDSGGAGSGEISIVEEHPDNYAVIYQKSGSLRLYVVSQAEIDVQGNDRRILDGSTTPEFLNRTNFGTVNITGDTREFTYTVHNHGDVNLTLYGFPNVEIIGADAAEFSVTAQPAISSIDPDGSTTFKVAFDPSSLGQKNAEVKIHNTDANETIFNFAITGTGGNETLDISFDSDGDGIDDADEEAEGTDPNDAGSVKRTLASSWFSEWNGFIGFATINEYVNYDTESHYISPRLYKIDGTAGGSDFSSNGFSLAAGKEQDVLVQDLLGWTTDSYGVVHTIVAGSVPGDIDGRTVLYRFNPFFQLEFAYALPYSNGFTGEQFIGYNTYQPSLDAKDASNTVVNWMQITNTNSTTQSGTVYYYDTAGELLDEETVSLSPRARVDLSLHSIGLNKVGLVQWRPDNNNAKFLIGNARYYFNNALFLPYFDGGLHIAGAKGNGAEMSLPLNTTSQTAVVELANITTSEITVALKFYNAAGTLLSTQTVSLSPRATKHVIANDVLTSGLGSVTIDSDAAESLIATGLYYRRTSTSGIETAYAIPAGEAIGTTVRGSYNTYLSQGCDLIITNKSNAASTATVSMTRLDGTQVLADNELSVPAKGTVSYDACANDTADNYGIVKVVADSAGALRSTLLRRGPSSGYVFPVEMR